MREGQPPYSFGSDNWPGLAKLAEECGEVLQVVGKMMMVGGDKPHWSGNLRAQLIDEMADVAAAIYFVRNYNLTSDEIKHLADRMDAKIKKFAEWHNHPEDDTP